MNLPAETAFVILLACAVLCGFLLLRVRRNGTLAILGTGLLCTLIAVVGSQCAMLTMVAAVQAS